MSNRDGQRADASAAGSGEGSTLAAMSVTVDLPDELLAALRAEAERRGVTIETVITESVNEHVRAPQPRRRLAFAGIGASGRGISDQVDELLAEGFGRD